MVKRVKRVWKRGLQLLLAALFVVGCVQWEALVPSAKAVTQAEIDALKNNASSLESQKSELQDQLDALSSDMSQALAQIELLDQKSDLIRAEIQNTESLIQNYENLIAQTQAELEVAEQREEEQYQTFLQQVRRMEEDGAISYWSVLFNATDFADLLGRLDASSEIMEYNQRVIDNLKATQAEISDKKAELETSLSETEAAKVELESQNDELEQQLAEAQALSEQIELGMGEYEEALAAIEAEEDRVWAEIERKEQELAASLGPATAGGYAWPLRTARRITCKFGWRTHPIKGTQSYHTGVDIGGVGYTSDILAAKDGVVLEATYSSSYGYYIVISHGAGNSTMYAHMSKGTFRVSPGDHVTQGQVIGTTGSTGLSTGPHLHYEIRENGESIDPLPYLPGYIQAW